MAPLVILTILLLISLPSLSSVAMATGDGGSGGRGPGQRDMLGQKSAVKTCGILEFVRDSSRVRIKSTGTLTHPKASFGPALELSRSPRPRVLRQQTPKRHGAVAVMAAASGLACGREEKGEHARRSLLRLVVAAAAAGASSSPWRGMLAAVQSLAIVTLLPPAAVHLLLLPRKHGREIDG
uniref:Uncharacterized protein n=1 Tax=Oryza sativa subsp. japonica TaxID=39947 RepID=Q10NC0_ORYSJ|nr:hypothetical protein LOC_Os03g16750 [Oryza sativa Japonica Group]